MMRKEILERLAKFESDHGVRITLAVESGSRGWGFASSDADYDVRFIYLNSLERYLHLRKPIDSYNWSEEFLHEGEICQGDFAGLDIFKFYGLLLKSNMNIMDWLYQTGENVYIDKFFFKEELKKAVAIHFSRHTYISHNFGLCRKNHDKYFINHSELGKLEPTAKRYIYCIRAILSARYCRDYCSPAPLQFDELMSQTLTQDEIKEVNEILAVKKATKERTMYRNEKWHAFIQDSLNHRNDFKAPKGDIEKYYEILNGLLISELDKQMRESLFKVG